MDEATKKKWEMQVGQVGVHVRNPLYEDPAHPGVVTNTPFLGARVITQEDFKARTPAHYDMPIQPYEFIAKNNLNFAEGSAIKYICRHRRKGGKDDLLKAVDFINKLIATEYPDE